MIDRALGDLEDALDTVKVIKEEGIEKEPSLMNIIQAQMWLEKMKRRLRDEDEKDV